MDSYFMVVAACECLVFMGSVDHWIQYAGARLLLYGVAFLIWTPISYLLRRDRATTTRMPAHPVRPATEPLPGKTLAVALPENVVIHFRLAPSGKRLGAAILDFAVMLIMISVFLLSFGMLFQYTLPAGMRGSDSMLLLAITALLVHGFWFEYFCQGQTAGKRHFGLKVIHCSGRPLEGPEALVRSVLRLPYFLPFLLAFHSFDLWAAAMLPLLFLELVMLVTSHWMQRLGDLAAGSVVIIDPR